MNTVILVCSALTAYIEEAQKNQGTDYPVINIDKIHHKEPAQMKQKVAELINALDPSVDTVLIGMGFCGGVWDHMAVNRRVVIPRVDDCASLFLHTDDGYHPNLKEAGHMYMYEKDPEDFSATRMMEEYTDENEYKGWSTDALFHMFFDGYQYLDIIDTGLNDCYTVEYAEKAQVHADTIHAALGYVQGSNMLLQKLVSGKWDHQFVVAEPGQIIKHKDFFE